MKKSQTVFFALFLICISLQTICAQEQRNLLAEFNKVDDKANSKRLRWSGKWSYNSRHYGAELNIKILSPDRFKFSVTASNGANSGEISGVAEVKGNKAYFDDRTDIKQQSDAVGCRLFFVNKGKIIDLEQSSECSSYGGLGVTFGRDFARGQTPVAETDFLALNVFPTNEFDRQFKVLVGKQYENFLDAFQLINEKTDEDRLNAKVFSACVRGNCPYNAAIIMFDGKGNIWAAVINVDDEKMPDIYYFTNSRQWAGRLPKTFKPWVADKRKFNNKNLTVVFKSKK